MAKLIVNGKEYEIPEEFTMGERADMESITGQDYDPSKGGYLGTLALMYVVIKRANPELERDDLLDDLRSLSETEIDFKGLPERPQPLGAPAVSAPPSTESSEHGSAISPAPTLASTGTDG